MPINLNTDNSSFVAGGIPVIDDKITPRKNKPEKLKQIALENVANIAKRQSISPLQKTFTGASMGGGKVGEYLEYLMDIDPTGATSTNAANLLRQIKGGEKEYKGLKESDRNILNQKKEAFFKSDYFKDIQKDAIRRGVNVPSPGDTDVYEGYLENLMINNPTAFKKEYKGLTPYFLTRGLQIYQQKDSLVQNK